MQEFLHTFLNPNLFIPHGHCYLWKPGLVELHVISDLTIAFAYYSIPITLLYFVRKRRDLSFYGIFLLFSAFIVSCGTTHLMEVWTLWHPIYWVSGVIKAITALFSAYTAFILVSLIPKVLALPSIAATNQKLEAEIVERQKTEIALRESEERFRSVFEQADVGMCLLSLKGQFIRFNRKFSHIIGYSQSELLNLKFGDITHPDDLAIDLEQVQKLLTGETQTFCREKRYIRQDSTVVQANVTVSLLRDAAGTPQQFISVVQDITDRVRAEQALQQLNQELEARVEQRTAALQASEERFRNLVETSSDLVWEIDENDIFTYISPKVFDILGYQPDEGLGKTPFDLMPKEETQRVAVEFSKQKDARLPIHCLENTNLHRCGYPVVLETSAVPIFDRQGNFQGYRGIDRDITQRKQAEADLLAITNLQKAILDGIDYAIISTNPEGVIQTFNPAAEKMLGYTAAEVIGQVNPVMFHDPEDFKQRAEAVSLEVGRTIVAPSDEFCKTQLQLGKFEEEWNYIRKDGSHFPVLLSLKLIFNSEGQPIGAVGIAKDITKQKQIEAQLRQNAAHLAVAQRIAHLGSWQFDLQTQEIVWSEEVFRIFGREPASGPPSYTEFCQSIHPDDLDRFDMLMQQTIEWGQPYEYEYRLLHPDGKLRYLLARGEAILDANGKPVRMVGTVLDLTDRKLAEEQLRNLSDRLTLALKSGAIGIWDWDIVRNLRIWDDRMYELYDLERTDPDKVGQEWFCQAWLSRIHPDDWAEVETALGQALQGEKEFDLEFRVIHTDGTVRFLKGDALIQRNDRGEPQRMIGINYDITDRKLAEEQLRSLSDRLTLALKSRAIGIWDCDMVNEAEWDDRMYELYGWSKSDRVATYQDWVNALHPDDRAATEATFQDAIRGEKEFDPEFRIVRPDGSIRYIKAAALFQRNERGEPQRMVGINYDITDRKLAEQQLQESRTMLQLVLDTIPQHVFWKDRQFRYLGCNQAFAGSAGLSHPDKIVGKTDLDLICAINADRYAADDSNVMTTGIPKLSYEELKELPDGSQRWLQTSKVPLTNIVGEVIGILGSYEDITDRKLAEQALAKYTLEVEDLYDNAPCGYHSLDGEGRLVKVNNTELQLLGYTREEMIGKPIIDFFTEASRLTFWQTYPVFKEQEFLKDIDLEMICKDGTILPVLISATVVKDAEGNYLYSRSSLLDIRDRKLAEENLRQMNEQLMLANVELARATRLKDEFLANMSHELRTPLNVILGMSEGLQENVFGEMNERQKKSIGTIERSGRHLLELINDILDLSKIEAGKLEIEISDVHIKNLCEASVVFVKHLALKKDIYLHTNIPENLGYIEADERRLRQALINLLSNAVKFTPERGSVKLEVRLEAALETAELEAAIDSSYPSFPSQLPCIPISSTNLCFDVIDTGIGIAPEDMDKLFQAFVQIDSSLSRRYSGTGLGLALVKRIANLHGGTVSVSSEVGRGSCFTIRIPYLAISKSDWMEVENDLNGAIENSISTSDLPLILLVEDNKPSSDTACSYLRSRGYRLIVATNGQQAINLIQIQQPNLILMDIQMPEMDGLEAIRQIRAQGQVDVPIVALTALAMPGDREKCLEAGADEYLTKPIQLKHLSQIIQQILAKNNENSS